MTSPKVFLSYASEDKDSFVRDFAIKLRAKHGVDLWLDDWEIKLGDSLIDAIFEGGLKHANVVIIVLSKASVTKPWVREELNIAAYKRIKEEKKLRIIPVIIEDCEVPEVLKNTAWVKVENPENCDTEIQRILSAIFDISPKPPLGTPPARFSASPPSISGLNKTDSLVLHEIANFQLDNNTPTVNFKKLSAIPILADMPEEELNDSLTMLEQHKLVKVKRLINGYPPCNLTVEGFELFAETYIPNYGELTRQLIALMINEKCVSNVNRVFALRIGKPEMLVNFILELMSKKEYLILQPCVDGSYHVRNLSPALKRLLQ
ncbi:MAG: hypothetical protein RL368_2277 [Pseudomonadota bacterium]|jgi:hypothetical protein